MANKVNLTKLLELKISNPQPQNVGIDDCIKNLESHMLRLCEDLKKVGILTPQVYNLISGSLEKNTISDAQK